MNKEIVLEVTRRFGRVCVRVENKKKIVDEQVNRVWNLDFSRI